MGMFSAPAPTVIQPDLPQAKDTAAQPDPQGLANWLKGAAGLGGSQALSQKHQAAGFNLGQQAMLGSGGQRSLFGSGARKAFG
jgi:hypothetical protein